MLKWPFSEKHLYHNESWELMIRRWNKLVRDFHMKNGLYDISKIPDIYDCIKYDLQHNNDVLKFDEAETLHALSKAMADIVIPQVGSSLGVECALTCFTFCPVH